MIYLLNIRYFIRIYITKSTQTMLGRPAFQEGFEQLYDIYLGTCSKWGMRKGSGIKMNYLIQTMDRYIESEWEDGIIFYVRAVSLSFRFGKVRVHGSQWPLCWLLGTESWSLMRTSSFIQSHVLFLFTSGRNGHSVHSNNSSARG